MKKESVVDLWIDAEEENRKHTQAGEEKCLELKAKFRDNFNILSDEDKEYVSEYLEEIGG